MSFTDPVKADVLADIDALRATVAAIEPTPDPNPLQAQLDAVTAERDALVQSLQETTTALNAAVDQRDELQAIVDAARISAQATVDALNPPPAP